MQTRFTYLPVVSRLHDPDALRPLVGAYLDRLESLGGARTSAEDLPQEAPHLWLVGTGGTERQILQLWAERRNADPSPVTLVAHADHNSLAAALEVLARLQQEGAAGRIVFVDGPDHPAAGKRLLDAVHDIEVEQALRVCRLGAVGAPSEWLVASSPELRTIREVWGPVVYNLESDALIDSFREVDDAALEAVHDDFVQRATHVVEPGPDALRDAMRIYVALRRVVDDGSLDALAVRCFDLVVREKTTACYAIARLNDEGIIAGCEGDLVTTVAMLWLRELLGQIPWMANVARADEVEDTMWLAHCTVPRKLVRDYSVRSHFESDASVALRGTFDKGPVTLVRIGGSNLGQLWLADAELVDTGQDERLCRTQAQLQLAPRDGCVSLLRHPLGNHLVLVPGHHAARLRAWSAARRSTALDRRREERMNSLVVPTPEVRDVNRFERSRSWHSNPPSSLIGMPYPTKRADRARGRGSGSPCRSCARDHCHYRGSYSGWTHAGTSSIVLVVPKDVRKVSRRDLPLRGRLRRTGRHNGGRYDDLCAPGRHPCLRNRWHWRRSSPRTGQSRCVGWT